MRLVRWERYVPDVEDNRARHARGEPALVLQVREPSAAVWRQFWGAIHGDDTHRARLLVLHERQPDGRGAWLAMRLATWNDALAEILWRGCVGAVEWPAGLVAGLEAAPPDGAALWALRHQLDTPQLYTDVLGALLDRAELEAGLADFLASPSSPHRSLDGASSPDGIAASVGPRS